MLTGPGQSHFMLMVCAAHCAALNDVYFNCGLIVWTALLGYALAGVAVLLVYAWLLHVCTGSGWQPYWQLLMLCRHGKHAQSPCYATSWLLCNKRAAVHLVRRPVLATCTITCTL